MLDRDLKNKTLKVALAAFMHDIGKFAQRSRGEQIKPDDPAFYPSQDFLNRNQQSFQPFNKSKNIFTHVHATYTAAFIDHLEVLLPECFNDPDWGGGAWIGELAAAHHILNEESTNHSIERWSISIADRLASSLDREGARSFEQAYNLKEEIKNFKSARQWPVTEAIQLKKSDELDKESSFKYRIPLSELSFDNFFPKLKQEAIPNTQEAAKEEYRKLFFKFYEELEGLKRFKSNVELWFNQFENLYMRYAGQIPAATVGEVMQDVSLYDHSKVTAAIATALYLYHVKTGQTSFEQFKAESQKKLLFIGTNFFGIQKFIFSSGGSTNKAAAKILRGRSFYVSVLSEIVADMLLKETGLPITSIIFNAAGQIAILAPNLDYIKEAVARVKEKTNNWLIDMFYGQTSLGIAFTEVSQEEIGFKYREIWNDFSIKMQEQKHEKFDLAQYGGTQKQFFENFNNQFGVCSFCGQKPAKGNYKNEDKAICGICKDQIEIGKKLVHAAVMVIWSEGNSEFDYKLSEPIFGEYHIWLGNLKEALSKDNSGLTTIARLTDAKNEPEYRKIAFKPLKAYVPFFDDSYEIKSFEDLADQAKKTDIKTYGQIGISALGVLKADVDNLGKIFSLGLNPQIQTLTRTSVLSRQFNNFFALYLPQKLELDFKNTYTVFAGGDDLFLIGPYDEIIELAPIIREEFKRFVCFNEQITISMGISIHKPSDPVRVMAEASEIALAKAKNAPSKNSLCLFGEVVNWNNYAELTEIGKTLRLWVEKEDINTSLLYKFNSALEDIITEIRLKEDLDNKRKVSFAKLAQALSWKARLKYSITRSVSDKHTLKAGDEMLRRAELTNMIKWLEEHKSTLRIPLWKEIYRRRRN